MLIGKLSGRLNDEGDVSRAGDVESEAVSLHAKAGIVCLHVRVPERGRPSAKRRSPACCSRQIINYRVGIRGECTQAEARRVPAEIDALQRDAVNEGVFLQVSEALSNRDARQLGTRQEGITSNPGDTVSGGDACQAGTAIERMAFNVCDGARDGV